MDHLEGFVQLSAQGCSFQKWRAPVSAKLLKGDVRMLEMRELKGLIMVVGFATRMSSGALQLIISLPAAILEENCHTMRL